MAQSSGKKKIKMGRRGGELPWLQSHTVGPPTPPGLAWRWERRERAALQTGAVPAGKKP